MKHILRYLFIGTLSLIPFLVVFALLLFLKNVGVDLIFKLLNITESYANTALLLFFIVTALALLGYTVAKYGKSLIITFLEQIVEKIPAIRTVYSISKKITGMFLEKNGTSSSEVVLVEYPKDDVWVVAYVINRYENSLVLFVPTSPNPTSGYTVIVEKSKVIKTTLKLEEASAFIISMGADFVKKEEIVSSIGKKEEMHK